MNSTPNDKRPASRTAGRRRKNAKRGEPSTVTKDDILAHAIKLAQNEPFSEISIVRLGRDLGVAPSLIHYYIGSRDDLLSHIINYSLRERVESLPPLTGIWREDLQTLMWQTLDTQIRWRGVTNYVATHNKYRLFQRVSDQDQDYGVIFFDRIGSILKGGGFTDSQAAMAFHLLMLFVTSVSSAKVNRQEPASHSDYILKHISLFANSEYPGATFLASKFAKVDTEATFSHGLAILLDGFEAWLAPPSKAKHKKISPTKSNARKM